LIVASFVTQNYGVFLALAFLLPFIFIFACSLAFIFIFACTLAFAAGLGAVVTAALVLALEFELSAVVQAAQKAVTESKSRKAMFRRIEVPPV
jgi:hypothetical protein